MPSGLYSHLQSLYYFIESVKTPKKNVFQAISANSWDDFVKIKFNKNIDLNKTVEMGLNCPRNATGNYYLETYDRAPFARGLGEPNHMEPMIGDSKLKQTLHTFRNLFKTA